MVAAKASTKFEEKKPNSNKSVEDKLDSLKSHITGKWTKTILKFMLPRIHNLVAVRERAKSMLIKRLEFLTQSSDYIFFEGGDIINEFHIGQMTSGKHTKLLPFQWHTEDTFLIQTWSST